MLLGVSVMVGVGVSEGVSVVLGVVEMVSVPAVGVRVFEGVGVAQKAVALATSTLAASLIVTMIAPYNPLIESVILRPEVSNPVGPLVRKTLFWNKFQV